MPDRLETRAVIIGGGGHARVLIDALQAAGKVELSAILDRNPALHGKEIFGVPVLGDESRLDELIEQGINAFVIGVGSVGNPQTRRLVCATGRAHRLELLSVIHPSAVISRYAVLAAGVQVMALAAINPGAQIGENVIINTGAIVEHDCLIGEFCHVSPGAVLCGDVHLGAGSHVGAGAVVRQGIRIGAGALVAAGAVVVKDVPDGVVVAGVPARLLKEPE